MSQSEKIKTAFERQSKALELRSGIGKGTGFKKPGTENWGSFGKSTLPFVGHAQEWRTTGGGD